MHIHTFDFRNLMKLEQGAHTSIRSLFEFPLGLWFGSPRFWRNSPHCGACCHIDNQTKRKKMRAYSFSHTHTFSRRHLCPSPSIHQPSQPVKRESDLNNILGWVLFDMRVSFSNGPNTYVTTLLRQTKCKVQCIINTSLKKWLGIGTKTETECVSGATHKTNKCIITEAGREEVGRMVEYVCWSPCRHRMRA
jgi:hypothetical protein